MDNDLQDLAVAETTLFFGCGVQAAESPVARFVRRYASGLQSLQEGHHLASRVSPELHAGFELQHAALGSLDGLYLASLVTIHPRMSLLTRHEFTQQLLTG